MTALSERRLGPGAGWVAILLALCAALGIICGVSPKLGIEAVVGIAFVVIVFTDLVLGLAVFAFMSFLDVLTIGGAALSFDKVAGLLLFTSWGLRQATGRPQPHAKDLMRRHPAMFVSMIAFVSWSLISTLWAPYRSVALTQSYRDILDMLLVPIVYAAVQSRRDLYTILIGFLFGAGFSALYGIFNPPALTSKSVGRLVGSLGEANQQATVLVAALVLLVGITYLARRSPKVAGLSLAVVILSVIGLVSTLSRAGLIALAFVLVAGVVVGGRWRRMFGVLLVVGVIGVPGYFFVLAPAHALARVSNSQSSGRNDIWMVGWRMFEAQPLIGVGAGNFQYVSANYLQHPGLVTAGNYFLVTPVVAQSIYLEQLSTLGIPGLLAMMAFLIAGVGSALKAAHIFERLGDAELELTSRCVVLALLAFLAADFFASELVSKQLWLVFALGPALLKLAQTRKTAITG